MERQIFRERGDEVNLRPIGGVSTLTWQLAWELRRNSASRPASRRYESAESGGAEFRYNDRTVCRCDISILSPVADPETGLGLRSKVRELES